MLQILIQGEVETVENDLLLDVVNLGVSFPLDDGLVQAVDGLTFSIKRGQVLGVVGESGCGKSVSSQAILRILPKPGRIDQGRILFYPPEKAAASLGSDVIDLAMLDPRGEIIRNIRGKEIAMVFQEAMTSLSPLHTIGNQIMEPIRLHQGVGESEGRREAINMLKRVGIPNAEQAIDSYPHEFSGGMRQRAMIAMGLSCRPPLLIADEPTTALDVTIQAQILMLLQDLQQEFGMAIMFITHNLGVIAQIADEVVIMYLGKAVERGPVKSVYRDPKHPYTIGLLKAVPRIGRTFKQRLFSIEGVLPSPFFRPRGCPFHPRCDKIIRGRCDVEEPKPCEVGEGHVVSCVLYA